MLNFTSVLKASVALSMGLYCLSASAAVNFIADPDPEAMVSELSSVTLTFPEVEGAVDYGSQYQNVTVTSDDFSRKCTLEYGDKDNQMVVSFDKITEEGTYTINFPADAITADNAPFESFSITYNVGEEVANNATLIPAPGEVEWLYEFVYFDPDVTGNLNTDSYGTVERPTVTTPAGVTEDISAVYDYQIGAGKYRFRLRRLMAEPGEYTVSFPKNYLYYQDAEYNQVYLPACEFTYQVTGGELTEVVSNPSVDQPAHNFNFLDIEFPGYSTISLKENMSYTESSVAVYIEGKSDPITSLLLTNFTIDGNKMSYVNAYSDYITPGHYFMTVPEGLILLGEEKTPCTPFVVEFEITAPDPVKIDITPADGATVSMLNSAVISFPEISSVDIARNPNVTLYKVTEEDGVETTVTIGGANWSDAFTRLSENSFKATFSGLATVDGDYRIRLAENSFVFDGGFNQEYAVNVRFEAQEAPEYVMTPDNTEAFAKLQQFSISFPNETVVRLNESLSNKYATLYKGEELIYNDYGYLVNSVVGSTNEYTAVEGSANSFSFTLSSAGLEEGKYVLVVPAGLFLMGEDESNFNAEVSIVYECNGEGIDKIEVTPSEPVSELKEMSITYINESAISFNGGYPGMSLYKYEEGQSYGTYIEYITGDALKIEGNTLYMTLSKPITEEGTYYVEITQYLLFMSDGVTVSTPQKVYFVVDPNAGQGGVDTIGSDLTDGRIFTITGLEVKDMKTPGIYVVNGRKVVVR